MVPGRLSAAALRAFRPRKRIPGALFTLLFAASSAPPRATCVVSKKVSAKAVVRNRIKRRCRAVLAHSELPHADLVFVAKREAGRAVFTGIESDVRGLIRRT